ncbi:hypothetical protein HDU81_002471 [Chytriomyces hyalinus]|nr:ubiquinol-cytochrome C reductase hinge domain-containing protein [Chytriomyces cf. hyalinus JEL632]KAJ3233169.1 hypothetical protein HDU81_002471 [Chytriomyces hyalinus]
MEDPKEKLEEACVEHHCQNFQEKLNHCGEKVEAGEEENCVEEFLKLMACVDHCAAPELFKKLQ